MIYPSVDKLLNLVDSKYRLVHIVAKRSKEIAATKHLQMPEDDYVSRKNIGRALEELVEHKIILKDGKGEEE